METKPPVLEAQQLQKKIFYEYWQEAKNAHTSGKKVAWVSGFAPAELLAAMDFFLVYPMNHSATCGAAGVATDMCTVAEEHGFSTDLCGYARCDIGSVLLGDKTKSPVGGPPKPDLMLVASAQQCHSIIKWFENISRYYDVPLVVIDVPFLDDGTTRGDESYATAYVREQLHEFIAFVEAFTKRRYNYDGMQECLANAAAAQDLWIDGFFNAAKNIPSPVTAFDLFINLGPMLYLRSRPEAVNYYRALKDEVAEKVRLKFSAVPNEKYRLFLNGMNWMKISSLSKLFASQGACLVTTLYPLLFLSGKIDPARPLDSLAERLVNSFLNRGLETRIRVITKLVKDFSLDGLVTPTIRGCKPISSFQLETMGEVKRLTGVPSLEFETCMVDTRYHSDAQVALRVQAFMELLEGRAQVNE